MDGWSIAIGSMIAAPVSAAVTVWLLRRIWRNARRLSVRARGQEHLIELAHLVGGLAHEIKNPLSTINVNLKLLSEDISHHQDEDSKRLVRRIKTVEIEAGRVKDILDDFLRFAGKVELAPTQTDLRQLLEELVDFFAPQADSTRVVLRTTLPDAPVPCRVDVNLIKQAVLNLMINATQAMPDGGELLIKLSAQSPNATIEVIDTGPGMDADQLAKIFDAYFSTRSGGSGLGLPTTRRIAQAHGGDIKAESELGKGTRFVFTIPLEQ